MMKMTKILSLLLALAMVFGLAACGQNGGNGGSPSADAPTFTMNVGTTALGNNWNPHTWETNADNAVQGYIYSPFVDLSVKDSKEGVYQWVYEMATSVTDVTESHKDDLTKYKVVLPEGQSAEDTKEGFVFEIKLNPNAKWANGEAITADDYIYSMQELLNPKMHNYRANNYISGESAVAGGAAYYNAGAPIYKCMVHTDAGADYDYEKGVTDGEVYVNVTSADYELYSMSLADLNSNYGAGLDEQVEALKKDANAYGYTKVTAENKETVEALINGLLTGLFGIDEAELASTMKEALFVQTGVGEDVSYDAVGLYKVDDHTINYVTETQNDFNYFMTSLTSTWLVYKDLYEAGKDTSGELITTNYGTKPENTMAYGPYMLESLETDKQMVFVQNPNWYGWEKGEDGSLVSFTNFEVDGEKKQQYRTTKVVIDVMDEAAMKQAFLKGELSSWQPNAEDLVSYSSSTQLYKEDETYTMSFFFHTNLSSLKAMDESKGNKNSVVLSNINFRKAFSLGIDRAEWVTATPGYKPAFSLLNSLYFYDIYNDPESSYRNSDQAKRAIVNLYEVEYGSGKAYATLDDAVDSITGYNLTEAKELMKKACEELVAAGLYKEGEEIHIRIGYKKGSLDSADNKQVELMNKYINAAAEGSGFGTITLEAVGNVEDRYGDTRKGEFAIGYGAWGGAAFYPFSTLRVYFDPDYVDIHEAGCWDPATEEITLTVKGKEETRTWKDWSNSLNGSGDYAAEDFDVKLDILSALEENYLKKYYRIPLAGSTICELLSYKHKYYTDDYNIMYGFGGLRLMTFNYNDAEWTEFVKGQNGELHYE